MSTSYVPGMTLNAFQIFIRITLSPTSSCRSTERVSNLPSIAQLVSERTKIQTQAAGPYKLNFFTATFLSHIPAYM